MRINQGTAGANKGTAGASQGTIRSNLGTAGTNQSTAVRHQGTLRANQGISWPAVINFIGSNVPYVTKHYCICVIKTNSTLFQGSM